MNTAERLTALRSAAGWLLWGTIVIVVDFRIGGSSIDAGLGQDPATTTVGVDLINDVIGAGLVVVGIDRLRAASRGLPGTDPWVTLVWVAALCNVPLILLEEVTGTAIGGTEYAVAGLFALLVTFGGTAAAAWLLHRAVSELTTDADLAERWRRNVWWVSVAGGLPALMTTVAPLLGLVEPSDRGAIVAVFGGSALLGLGALAFGLIALIMLLTALSQTRQLSDPSPPSPTPPASASGAISS